MRECYIQTIRSINLINKENILIWDIQKNIGVDVKWALKKEELVKEIKGNKIKKKYNIIFLMKSVKFSKKIKNYAIASFLIPLIAVNSCLLIYKYLGYLSVTLKPYININWDIEKIEFSYNDFDLLENNIHATTYTNCPKHTFKTYFITDNNKSIERDDENFTTIVNLGKNNKIKSVIIKSQKDLELGCIKNHQYTFLKTSNLLKVITDTLKSNTSGFSKIKNPYFYGEVSISRTARYSPAIWIFRPLIILSAVMLFLYWKNNLNLFRELKNENTSLKFSKSFFYFGVFSCIFLILHATFLGLDIDSKLFAKIRKLIITLFILFEILAQITLTKTLYKCREELKKYINLLILKIKIVFVAILFFISCVAFTILTFGDPSSTFKHILEWNYFSFLLLFYLLTFFFWKKS